MLFDALQDAVKADGVVFTGSYLIPKDPLVTAKDRVQMTALEVWKVTGYRFRSKN